MVPDWPTDFCYVPAGAFLYGPEECYERLPQCRPLRPAQSLELPGFWLGRAPVTYAQWQTFLVSSGYRWEGSWYEVVGGWRGRLVRAYAPCAAYPASHAELAIVDVSRDDARAYCRWLSDRIGVPCSLPTEEQWEKAARGTDGRTYPWGNEAPRPELQWQGRGPVGLDTYLFSLVVPASREYARSGWYWRNGHPMAVGHHPRNVSPYGCVDMSGGVWEWTSSLYNDREPALSEFHTVKGGSWGYSVHHTKANVRSACSVTTPSRRYRAQGTGFRVCVPLDRSEHPPRLRRTAGVV